MLAQRALGSIEEGEDIVQQQVAPRPLVHSLGVFRGQKPCAVTFVNEREAAEANDVAAPSGTQPRQEIAPALTDSGGQAERQNSCDDGNRYQRCSVYTRVPMSTVNTPGQWWARGLIFENCSCTLVCPGHMHFSQNCTHERCKGFWAIRFDDGSFGGVALAGTRAVVAFDTPQRMIDGGWLETIIIDESATAEQRRAIETLLSGGAGGPWEKLAQFVARRQPTEFRAIEFADEGATKRATIVDRLRAVVSQIRGRDRSKPVLFENIFNQIHAPQQIVALGESQYDDGVIRFANAGSHGLFSSFEWTVAPAASPSAM